MSQVMIMNMTFEENAIPDFGSIRMTQSRANGCNEYVLKSVDAHKLNSITNAADGSTALCTDTWDIYVLHMGEWCMVGGGNDL